MNQYIVNGIYNFLLKHNNYTEKEKIVAKYGLETLYVAIEKTLIILVISLIFGITKKLFVFIFFFGFLRTYSGGVHMKSGLVCTFLSFGTFFLGYLFSNYFVFNKLLLLLYIPFTILFIKYSPADTSKKPIIRKNLRKKRKIYSIIIVLAYLAISIFININYIQNVLLYSIIFNGITITPLCYKIFNQPYNNYLIYENLKKGSE